MRYEGKLYRPPSEAHSLIVQATIGCSWNHCTYCDMYREKNFRIRSLAETLEDIARAGIAFGTEVRKVFVADGDALILPMDHWLPILRACRKAFPHVEQVSCYAMAKNVLEKTGDDLEALRDAGLTLLYIGPESGDDITLKRIAKGATFQDHVAAATKAHASGMAISVITLLGIGQERAREHAIESARLVTEMDPRYWSALTVTVVPGTPLHRLEKSGRFSVPEIQNLLLELRTMVEHARPRRTLFRTNHASNYLPLGGELPRDTGRVLDVIDRALAGAIPLRSEATRGL